MRGIGKRIWIGVATGLGAAHAMGAGCSGSEPAMRLVRMVQGAEAAPPAATIPLDAPVGRPPEDEERMRAWYDRNLLEAYRRVGRRSPGCDPMAEELIRGMAANRLFGDAVPIPEQARAVELLKAGCDDPVVLYLASVARWQARNQGSWETTDLMERSVAGMHEVPYPRGAARWAASRLRWEYDGSNEGGGRRKALDPVELRWFVESLADGSYGPDDDAVLVEHLFNGTGPSLFRRNRAAVVGALESAEGVDPWVRHLMQGERHVADAWNSRGNAYAREVTDEGWKGFTDSLAAARKAYTESWRLRPDRPEAAAEMITVAKALSMPGETPRLWFDRAVAARLDYWRAYDLLVDALRRRWGGGERELLAFARECADTRRFDTNVPYVSFMAVEQLEADRFDEWDTDLSTDWPETRPPSPYQESSTYEMVAAVLERYRRYRQVGEDWKRYASLQAAIAYKARRYEDALKPLRAVGGVLDDAARRAVDEELLESRIEVMASAAAAASRRAAELYRSGDVAGSAALLRDALAAAPSGAHPFLEHRLAIASLEAELAEGRPATFLPRSNLAGWSAQVGDWAVEPDGSLVGTSGARGLLIVCEAHVGADFEIVADVEIVSTSNGQFQAGIVFGEKPTFESQRWSSFRVKKTAHEGEVAYFSRHFVRPVQMVERGVPRENHVVVRSWNGRLWAYVNGDAVIQDYRAEWNPPQSPEVQLGFGAYLDDNVFSVRYRNVRLRRLLEAPEPPSSEAASSGH